MCVFGKGYLKQNFQSGRMIRGISKDSIHALINLMEQIHYNIGIVEPTTLLCIFISQLLMWVTSPLDECLYDSLSVPILASSGVCVEGFNTSRQ